VSVFPGETYQAPRSWTEKAYHNLIYFQRGGQGRPLRSLGTAKALFRRGSRGLQIAALSEIALAAGFSDQAHFSNKFRRTIGKTPGEWRRSIGHERAQR
jgi:AraC-like DNA-binding protein